MQDADVEEGMLQLVLDQVEELVVTVIEEIRARPGVALAICAGIAGTVVGSVFAARLRRPRRPAARVAHQARRAGDMAELVGLTMRLLQNPIVRGLIVAAITRQLKRQLPR